MWPCIAPTDWRVFSVNNVVKDGYPLGSFGSCFSGCFLLRTACSKEPSKRWMKARSIPLSLCVDQLYPIFLKRLANKFIFDSAAAIGRMDDVSKELSFSCKSVR